MYSLLQMSSRAQKNIIFENFSEEKLIYDLVRKHVKIYSLSIDSATMKNLTELIDIFLSEYENIFATNRSFISILIWTLVFVKFVTTDFKCPSL